MHLVDNILERGKCKTVFVELCGWVFVTARDRKQASERVKEIERLKKCACMNSMYITLTDQSTCMQALCM